MTTRIRILSYNIHKGFSSTNIRYVLKNLKKVIHEIHPDLVLLQEVLGHHNSLRVKLDDWPTSAQFEYLADQIWPHYAYGKNSVYSEGHHGNAILSKFPIEFFKNQDVSMNRFEKRGILHAVLRVPQYSHPLHVFCVHLGLFETDRRSQVNRICQRILEEVPPGCPLIVGGDFNDWRESASKILKEHAGLDEVFLNAQGEHVRTFPSWLPVLRLDRMYSRGLKPVSAELLSGGVWQELSDHLPIIGEFDFLPSE